MKKKRRAGSARLVSAENMAVAEDVLTHGTSTRLRRLKSATLVALCTTKLQRSIKDAPRTKDEALVLLEEYVRY